MLYTIRKDKEYKKIVKDIFRNKEFKKICNIEHHGISRMENSIKISYYSYKIAKKLGIDYVSVARGGLLHDFFLDGDERNNKRKFLDTFTHPKKALETAQNNFELNEIEKNIIKGGSGFVRCRLVCSITLTGSDVKGGKAMHLPLTSGSGSVTRAFGQQRRSTTGRGSGSNPVGGQSTFS